MKRFFAILFTLVVGLGVTMHDAEARRLGGGKSFGMQRGDNIIRRDAAPAPQVPQRSAAAPSQPGAMQPMPQKRSWLGPLAGLAAGIGLAALFSHFGMGGEFASFVMILLLVFGAVMLFKLFFGRKTATPGAFQYAGGNVPAPERPVYGGPVPGESVAQAAPATVSEAGGIPGDFDAEGFVRQAKLNFIRLQAANDAGNLEDIREFTSPELYAEIKMQLDERGGKPQRTDIVNLNADLLDVTSEATRHVVSVRFHGMLREDGENAPPTAFDEVWHLTKPVSGERGWIVAGIEQRN
ncbi:MAG: Tim44 domain-containing protein [Zoogloea sp.]|nr:Tim44 domain-containing protein [Zoogloea sp.]